MLLDRGRLHPLAQALNVLSDVDRLDLIERADSAHVAPAQKRFGLRILTVKKSRKRFLAPFSAPAMIAGNAILRPPPVLPMTVS